MGWFSWKKREQVEPVLGDTAKSVIFLLKSDPGGWVKLRVGFTAWVHRDTKIAIEHPDTPHRCRVLLGMEQGTKTKKNDGWAYDEEATLTDYDISQIKDHYARFRHGEYRIKGGKAFALISKWAIEHGHLKDDKEEE